MGQSSLFEPPSNFNGNKKPVDYGIEDEGSDYRAHICYPGQLLYLFPTRPACAIAKKYVEKTASVPGSGITTGWGNAVPISHIPQLRSIRIPMHLLERYRIFRTDSTSMKGHRSVQIFLGMLKMGIVPLPMNGTEVTSPAQQIAGADVVAFGNYRIQVKCDWPASEKGNLFIQFKECNPGRMH